MTREERIHHLFNELHRELIELNADLPHEMPMRDIASQVDAAHHDFTTNITLQEVSD